MEVTTAMEVLSDPSVDIPCLILKFPCYASKNSLLTAVGNWPVSHCYFLERLLDGERFVHIPDLTTAEFWEVQYWQYYTASAAISLKLPIPIMQARRSTPSQVKTETSSTTQCASDVLDHDPARNAGRLVHGAVASVTKSLRTAS